MIITMVGRYVRDFAISREYHEEGNFDVCTFSGRMATHHLFQVNRVSLCVAVDRHSRVINVFLHLSTASHSHTAEGQF
jgi:hypothetical protein